MSDLFHDLFAYDIGGEELDSTPPYVQVQERNSRKNTVAVGQKFGIPEVEFGHEKRALWSEGIRDRNVD